MNCMSLFAGVGGFDLAIEWMGWRTVVMVEWDKKRRMWLQKLYPHSTIHGDIDTFDNTPYRHAIDLICGGEPCQGNSLAGNRKGESDPRFKWPAYLQQVDEVAPIWVVNENVPGSISNGILDRKVGDLEEERAKTVQEIEIMSERLGQIDDWLLEKEYQGVTNTLPCDEESCDPQEARRDDKTVGYQCSHCKSEWNEPMSDVNQGREEA